MSRLEARIPTSVYEQMACADQIAFAQALIDPPEPNAKLKGAKRRHDALIQKR